MTSVAQVERPAIVKALATWVDLEVIKEDSPNNFRLLNVAEETGDAGSSRAKHPGQSSFLQCQVSSDQSSSFSRRCRGSTTTSHTSATASGSNEGILEGMLHAHLFSCLEANLVSKFIEGMLKNLGTLPLDRIQQMLKFAPGYNRTIEQLAGFMEAARREGLVTVKDGMWKLQAQ